MAGSYNGLPFRPKKVESSVANQELALRLFGRFVERRDELLKVGSRETKRPRLMSSRERRRNLKPNSTQL